MKIAHIIPTLNAGGAEKLIVDAIPGYIQEGYEVDIIVLKTTDSFLLNDLRKVANVIELGKGSVYNPLHILKLKRYLLNYNLVHLHLFPVLYWCVFANYFFDLNIPLIYTEHSTNNRRRGNILFQLIDKWVYKKLTFVGCISNGTKINLIQHLGYSPKRIEIINNGINLKVFNIKPDKTKGFFKESDFVIVQVSSFREQKDQKTLIRSLKGLDSRIKLLLVGDGILKGDCEALVADLELQDRVKFLGIRKDIPFILSMSDVVVLSSVVEGFGLAAVEGMAARKPVIASDIDGLREVVKGSGILFKTGNYQELGECILKLYHSSIFYEEIAGKCFERAKEFDISKMIKSYSKVYNSLIP